jgi:hypothetical protein
VKASELDDVLVAADDAFVIGFGLVDAFTPGFVPTPPG